jgi:hypothetical protein
MAKIAVTFKILFVWIYNGFVSLLLDGVYTAQMANQPLNHWQIFCLTMFSLTMVFLPEILFLTSADFRKMIIEGVQDGDGITHAKDLRQTGILYVSLWSMRVFMGFSLAMIFGMKINLFVYVIPLIGSFGTAGLAVISQVLGKRV